MDVKPTVLDRAAPHIAAFRATVVLLAALAAPAAYLAGRHSSFSGVGAVLAGAGLASFWVAILILIDRVESARQRRLEGMQRVRDFAQRLVIYDRETGLYADWYFRLRLQEELARSRRFGHPCALMLAESTRGRLGREGEQALFQAITKTFRGTDLVAHMGSLRFAVLLSNTAPEGAQLARDRLEASVPAGSLLIGFACYPDDGEDWRSLFAAAGGPSGDLYAGAGQDWAGNPANKAEPGEDVA